MKQSIKKLIEESPVLLKAKRENPALWQSRKNIMKTERENENYRS